tara:strand:- start:700 stop:1263 length:564 start_codon:yes stop_codon:yes gene_type:complete
MGSKRVGLRRIEALIERLKRDLDLSSSTISGATIKGHKREIIALTNAATTARSLLASESGAVVTCAPTTAGGNTITVTMPPVAGTAGVWYDIAIIADAADGDADVILTTASASGADFVGMITQGGAANHTGASQTVLEIAHGTLTFNAGVSTTFGNSVVRVVSNGTHWLITGNSTAVSGVTNPVLSN